jgi:CubicO group peptidase (beta-lactamase class C family)
MDSICCKRIGPCLLLLLVIGVSICAAQGIPAVAETTTDRPSLTARIDKLFAAWDRRDTPGCALAVIQDGKVIYKRGYGMANLEYGIAV